MEAFLNGREIYNEADFHKQIKIVLGFPSHYGENLDALWDCLTGWIDIPTTLIWNDFEFSTHALGEYALKLRNLFEDAQREVTGFKVVFK